MEFRAKHLGSRASFPPRLSFSKLCVSFHLYPPSLQVPSELLKVGDLVRVKRESEFPCDLAVLASSDSRGAVYVQVAGGLRCCGRAAPTISLSLSLPLTLFPFLLRSLCADCQPGRGVEPQGQGCAHAAGGALRGARGRTFFDDQGAACLAPLHPPTVFWFSVFQGVCFVGSRASCLSVVACGGVWTSLTPYSAQGSFTCEEPNKDMELFNGVLTLDDPVKDSLSFSSSQLLLQVTHLKNIEFVVGLAVYTGLPCPPLLPSPHSFPTHSPPPLPDYFSSVSFCPPAGNQSKCGLNKESPPTKWTKVVSLPFSPPPPPPPPALPPAA